MRRQWPALAGRVPCTTEYAVRIRVNSKDHGRVFVEHALQRETAVANALRTARRAR